jgi:hypothetical protein
VTICCTALRDLAALIAAHVQHVASLDNGMSETPALAWSTWNYFNGNVSDTLVREMADAMHDTGLFALGFRQINIDSGYLLLDRAADGSLQVPVWREFHQLYSPLFFFFLLSCFFFCLWSCGELHARLPND